MRAHTKPMKPISSLFTATMALCETLFMLLIFRDNEGPDDLKLSLMAYRITSDSDLVTLVTLDTHSLASHGSANMLNLSQHTRWILVYTL